VSVKSDGTERRMNESVAPYRLRPMRKEDISLLMPIEVRSYSLPWTEAAFHRELTDIPFSRLLVVEPAEEKMATKRGVILGYGCWWFVKGECHITNVTASPEARCRGVGRFLMRGILDDARRRGATRAALEVRVSNKPAIALYEKSGFTSVAIRQAYYPDNGEDALVMWMASL